MERTHILPWKFFQQHGPVLDLPKPLDAPMGSGKVSSILFVLDLKKIVIFDGLILTLCLWY